MRPERPAKPLRIAIVTNGEVMSTTANARPDRIVVVDDDARIRDLLRRYLTQHRKTITRRVIKFFFKL